MSEEQQAAQPRGVVNLLQEFSIPLILGVVTALLLANLDEHFYHKLVHWEPFGHWSLFGHHITFHWLVNDIFMVFFFGIAAKEITESMLPGGALNPPSKAINPLLGTIGGVAGPIAVFFLFNMILTPGDQQAEVANGWGVPTATDIALAWLVARAVFGAAHPAVNFLLLLAIADDAIGLIIIAVFYGDPLHPAEPMWLLLALGGMVIAFALRKGKVRSWVPYVLIAGVLSWLGFLKANLHPALALVPIIPLLPGPVSDVGLFREEADDSSGHHDAEHSTLENFEHHLKMPVDFGLFFFGLANAGVVMAGFSEVTIVILLALVVGKVVGISLFSAVGNMIGFKYPTGMSFKHVAVAGVVAAIGLTVALFVAGEAYPSGTPGGIHQGPAKMGALLSAGAAFVAIIVGRMVNAKSMDAPQ